jgi:hypothetical protein
VSLIGNGLLGLRLAAGPAAIAYRESTLMHAPAALPVYLG